MKLSTRGDYGVRVVLELSRAGQDTTLTVPDLSARIAVSTNYLQNILQDLRSHGIVRSTRGPRGGFSVARPPADITIGQVVRAMDGPLAPMPCASQTAHAVCPPERCPSASTCVLRSVWSEVRDAIAAVVDGTTFGDLLDREVPAASALCQI